jgi:hypothetical protein
MYVKANNGVVEKYPYTTADLTQENPNVSFPSVLGAEILANFNVFQVIEQEKPDTDNLYYIVKRHLPEMVNGEWVLLWDVIQKTQEQLDEEAEIEAEAIRSSRNKKLSLSDWTQIEDAPVNKQAWATYRQALRDVPSQAGFPWEVTWPQQP